MTSEHEPNHRLRLALTMAAVLPVLAGPALAVEPVLTRVTLSSGGVGQYEFTAEADGPATVPLDVPLDQVDDLLKSLRVDDPAGGMPSVRLPGRQPLTESFRTLPFGPDALGSPEALLGGLVGEAVRVPGPGIVGTILAINPFQTALPDGGGTLTHHRLTLATATGVESVVLEDVPGVEFSSPALRRQIAAALAAIAGQRVQDRRTLQLTLAEGGRRTVRFGYVVPAPVWKASYRLVTLADGVAAPARLQGFAIVENLSGRDWLAVEVVLTSGQPVLYHQPLYEAVYVARPDAPVEVANRLVPRVDQGALPTVVPDGGPELRQRMAPAPIPSAPPAPVARAADADAAGAGVAQPPSPSPVRQSVAQVEFHLAGAVSAAAGESLMLPIADRPMPARRVALFQPETDPLRPLVALLLTNDTAGAMPPGLATLFEQRADGTSGFIGDARLPAMQPGEERLASFAADLAVRIDAVRTADTLLTSGRAVGGVLTLERRERASTWYRIVTPAASGRTVMIEQAKRPGWTLAEPGDAASTPTHYRVVRTVGPGATDEVAVVLERPRGERILLADAGAPRLLALAEEGRLSPGLRAAMTRAAALRTELDQRSRSMQELRERRAETVADQGRIRSNLAAVPANSELQRRYLAQLQQQENDLAALASQTEAAQRAVSEAEAALTAYLMALDL